MTQYESQSTERSTAGLALVLLLCLPGCPNGDDDDSADAPLCTVRVWYIDDDGDRAGSVPDFSFLSDGRGRLLSRVTRGGSHPLVRYAEGQLTAIGLGDLPDFVWENGRVVAYTDASGKITKEFTYADGLLTETREPVELDGNVRVYSHTYEYTNRLLARVVSHVWFGNSSYVNERATYDWDLDGCLTRVELEDPNSPMDQFITTYQYGDDGRLQTLRDSGGGRDFEFVGQCDDLGAGLPRFAGVPYWLRWGEWPIDGCW